MLALSLEIGEFYGSFYKEGITIAVTDLNSLQRRLQRRSLQIFSCVASVQLAVPSLLGIVPVLLHAAEEDLPVWRKQLQAAEASSDRSAIVELSRRILDAVPNDSQTWETLASKQLELDDQDRCAATLDAWETHVHPPSERD